MPTFLNQDLNVDTVNTTGDVEIEGNLTVTGTTTTVSTTNTVVSDKLIELANGTSGTPSGDAGIIIERGSSNNAAIIWDESADTFVVGTTTATGASTGDLSVTDAALKAAAITSSGVVTATGFTIGSAVIAESELEQLDGITAGTVTASKAVVVDANKDVGTIRNLTIDGTFSDGNYTFDTSGNVSGLGTVGCGAITSSGDISTTGEVKTAKVAFTDGDDAITIADGGGITANTSLTLASGSTVTAIKDEDNLSSDSATSLATQQSIKAYVDSQVGGSGNMDNWVLEDDDGTEVTVSNGKEVKFIGSGITTNFTDTDNGTDGDPYDLTFTVDAAQTGITSILATDVKIGEDDQTKIDFETADQINFYANNAKRVTIDSSGLTIDSGSLETATIDYTDGDLAITIADGGGITAAAGITSTAAANTLGATSFNDANITNVGDIALDSISADGTDINVAVSDNSATALTIKQGSDAYLIVDTANSSESVAIGTGVSGTAVSIGHTTSETTVNDNLTVTGDLTVNGTTTTINSTTLTVDDKTVVIASGASDSAAADGAGISIDGASATLTYAHSGTKFVTNKSLDVTGTLTATNLAGTLTTAAQTNITSVGTLGALTVDDVAIDGKVVTMTGDTGDTATLTVAAAGVLTLATTDAAAEGGNIILDADGDVHLDAETGKWRFKKGSGGTKLKIDHNNSGDITFENDTQDKDFIFKGDDGGGVITALTLDMSEAGAATFNNKVIATELDISGDIDVDGTTNLDNTDIDGTFQMDGATFDVNASGLVTVDGAGVSIDSAGEAANFTVASDGAAEDLTIAVTGNTDSSVVISSTGTGADAINIDTTAGSIDIDSADNITIDAADDISITSTSADGLITLHSAHTAGQSILIDANANAGSILDIDAGIIDIDVQDAITIDAADEIVVTTSSADGHISLVSAHTAGVAVHIDANADAGSIVDIDAGILDIDVTGAATIDAAGLTITSDVVIAGATPTLTIGDDGAEDTMLIFDGNAEEFRIGIDDGTDTLEIGVGTAHGTNPVIKIDDETNCQVMHNSGVADGKFSGDLAVFQAGEDLTAGEVVYFKSDGKVHKAVATASATSRCVAMATATISADAMGVFLLKGFARFNSEFPTWTVGGALFTPEAETSSKNVPEQTAPADDGDFVQVIGFAISADAIYFNPDSTVIEVA